MRRSRATGPYRRAVGTPFYCYSTATLERHFRVFAEAVSDLPATVCFAVKANPNIAVIRTLARLGAGADVVSGGELTKALAAGVPAERIVFSGVGKTAEEMALALKAGILQINVESEPELAVLDAVAGELGVVAPIAVRVNPDVDAHTHHKITTGKSENKFGIDWTFAREFYARAAKFANLRVVGISVHIGSQLRELGPFREAFARVREMVLHLREDGHAIERIDLGGGLGIPYGDDADDMTSSQGPGDYAAVVKEATRDLDCQRDLRAGSGDRRQRRCPGDPRAVRQARRDAALRHRRRGDERSDPARPCTTPIHAIVPVAETARRRRRRRDGRGRPGVRDRRYLRRAPPAARGRPRRPAGHPLGGGLRRGDVVDLQHPAAHSRGPGQGRCEFAVVRPRPGASRT